MPQNFLTCDRDQPMLLPPDLRDRLSDDHLAWFVIDAVTELDLEPFYAAYRGDGQGAAAHDPTDDGDPVRLRLRGRRALGTRDRAPLPRGRRLPGDLRQPAPDHATIARFRVRHEEALADLFGGVLGLCAKAGIVDVGVIAVDGTKLAASATHRANRSYQQIAEEIVAEAAGSTPWKTSATVKPGATSCPRGSPPATAGALFARQRQSSSASAPKTPSRCGRDRSARLETCRRRLAEDWQAERWANERL